MKTKIKANIKDLILSDYWNDGVTYRTSSRLDCLLETKYRGVKCTVDYCVKFGIGVVEYAGYFYFDEPFFIEGKFDLIHNTNTLLFI